MLEFTTHNYFFFKRREIWFYNGEELKKEAYTVFSAAKTHIGSNDRFYEKNETSVINLNKSETDIVDSIHPTFRYDIRAAGKVGITTLLFDTPTKVDCMKLINDYAIFAAEKGLPKMSNNWVNVLQAQGNICFSKAFLGNIEIATHVYIYDKQTVSLTSSFHNNEFKDNKLRSAANKLLHLKDILAFKEKGFITYDFGGLNYKKLPGVSKFKSNFGGDTLVNYRFIKTSLFMYKIISFIKKIKK